MDKDAMTPEEIKKTSCYQIRLRGLLNAKWADWFDGFTIAYAEGNSILTGLVLDQPALHGMLAKIRDLGLPLISVVLINELKEKPGSAGLGSPPISRVSFTACNPPETIMMSALTTALVEIFARLAAQDKFSGVVRITRGDEELFATAYGYASRPWKVPNSLATRFDTASITKLFTAVAALQQIERGKLSFETCAVDYLDLKDTAISPAVNLFHLLTHSSGIGDDADEENGEDYADLWVDKANYSVTQAEHFLPQFAHKPSNFPPGEGCRYCNCGYVLAGLMVEKASGMKYRDYVREDIFARAGMSDSDFFHMAEVHENVAEGADPVMDAAGQISGWKKNIYSYPPIGTPDGGAHVTAADLERFLRAIQRGKLLTPKMTHAFFTPQVLHDQRESYRVMYGPGLWFHVEENGQVLFYEKEGQNAGASGMIRHYPAHDLSVVILTNMGEAAWKPIQQVHELLTTRNFECV